MRKELKKEKKEKKDKKDKVHETQVTHIIYRSQSGKKESDEEAQWVEKVSQPSCSSAYVLSYLTCHPMLVQPVAVAAPQPTGATEKHDDWLAAGEDGFDSLISQGQRRDRNHEREEKRKAAQLEMDAKRCVYCALCLYYDYRSSSDAYVCALDMRMS